MKEISAQVILEDVINGIDLLKRIERAGRTCYKSEELAKESTYIQFIKMILKNKHESVLEHEKVTLRIICDRGVTHEIVRHRIGSYSQESTRYCNYADDKFGNDLTFIKPLFWGDGSENLRIWRLTMQNTENAYLELIKNGAKPQEARSVLPNSLKTEIVVTYNLREWRHFLKLRLAKDAHPQMQEVAKLIHEKLKMAIPLVFDDYSLE
ncbi:thymidylate synthase [Planctomycetales bacterium]|nr:thymidylate synthase [Planctomycetales bacterium]GHS98548.1 thymidylate synthase [Planctomycetales bacterium]